MTCALLAGALLLAGTRPWTRSYDIPGTAVLAPRAIVETRRGYVVAGTSACGDDTDVWIASLDHDGRVVWAKQYEARGRQYATTLHATLDAGLILSASTDDGLWIVRLDARGAIRWQKSFVASQPASIVVGNDGAFTVVATNRSSTIGPSDVWIAKLRANGTTEWQYAYNYFGQRVRATDVTAMPDGGLAIAGTTFASHEYLWMLRLTPDGAVVWQKTFFENTWARSGVAMGAGPSALTATPTGSIVIVGGTAKTPPAPDTTITEAAWAVELSPEGWIVWQNRYSVEGRQRAFSVRLDPSGNLIVAGRLGWPQEPKLWLAKLDSRGAVLWERAMRGTGEAPFALPANDGTILLQDETGNDLKLLRAGPTGELPEPWGPCGSIVEPFLASAWDTPFYRVPTQFLGEDTLATATRARWKRRRKHPYSRTNCRRRPEWVRLAAHRRVSHASKTNHDRFAHRQPGIDRGGCRRPARAGVHRRRRRPRADDLLRSEPGTGHGRQPAVLRRPHLLLRRLLALQQRRRYAGLYRVRLELRAAQRAVHDGGDLLLRCVQVERSLQVMRRARTAAAATILGVLLLGGILAGDGESERSVQAGDVPQAALEALKRHAAGAALTEFSEEVEHGHTFYEGSWKGAHGNVDGLVTPTGALVELEEKIPADQVPQEVRTAAAQLAGDAKLSFEKKTVILYEVHYRKDGRGRENVLTPDGRPFHDEGAGAEEGEEDEEE
ncbi:MAG TPA: hypothetical protein VJS92_08445 [Candidatus Polarisedimenticolaceae bacterium]|nr:hypothetical protein [Candidatus Polarisedimenticolaceae bacterium]